VPAKRSTAFQSKNVLSDSKNMPSDTDGFGKEAKDSVSICTVLNSGIRGLLEEVLQTNTSCCKAK